MTERITYEMVDDLLFEDLDSDDLTPAQHLELSKTAEEWATNRELEDEELRPMLLVAASDHATDGGDIDRALRLARQTVEASDSIGDRLIPDVRTTLYQALRRANHLDEALELEAEMRRDLPDDIESFDAMGSILDSFDDVTGAQRWYTMGIRFAERNGLLEEFEYEVLLISRFDVREKAGLPRDDYDMRAAALLAEIDEQP